MARKTINDLLETGETLLWEGAPAPGRAVSRNGWIWLGAMGVTTVTFFMAALALMTVIPTGSPLTFAPFGLVVMAAFATFVGLNMTYLERRRARARDGATRFALTDQRALSLIGPYDFALPLSRDTEIEYRDGPLGALILRNTETDALSFDRLLDGDIAQKIASAQIEASALKAHS
ncbi:MAG: hypothetical protein ACRBCL_04405 [Maritimibacter sp.]